MNKEISEKELMKKAFDSKKSKNRLEVRKKSIDTELKEKRQKLMSELNILSQSHQNTEDTLQPQQEFEYFPHLNSSKQMESESQVEDDESEWEWEDDDLNINDISQKQDNLKAINFCLKHKLLFPQPFQKCNQDMVLQYDKSYGSQHVWRCFKCNQKKKLYQDNKLFDKFIAPIYLLLWLFATQLPRQIQFNTIQLAASTHQYKLSNTLLTKARKIYCACLNHYYENEYLPNFRLLGSNKEEVEIDESCFKRKYNRGRYRGQQWNFGLTERNGGFDRTLMFPVPDRTKNTLLSIIKLYVSKSAKCIYSDEWKSYSSLKELGYNHKQINHSKQFVSKTKKGRGYSNIHTQKY